MAGTRNEGREGGIKGGRGDGGTDGRRVGGRAEGRKGYMKGFSLFLCYLTHLIRFTDLFLSRMDTLFKGHA